MPILLARTARGARLATEVTDVIADTQARILAFGMNKFLSKPVQQADIESLRVMSFGARARSAPPPTRPRPIHPTTRTRPLNPPSLTP